MASRLVEIFVPVDRADDLRGTLSELELDALTQESLEDGRLRVRVLVDVDRSGALLDRLQLAFGTSDRFSVLVLPVEAVLPRREAAATDKSTVEKTRIGSRGISREELLADISELARLSRVFVATVALSTVVAAVGMLRDNVAVIIGAMVIAPLLGPNVALAFGTTLGDLPLIRRSLSSNLVGMVLALGVAVMLGVVLDIDPTVQSIEDRTVVHLSDIVLALASGSACALALTTGLPTALVGVMVAVALLPPTVAVGLLVGDGHWKLGAGSALLLLANVICVNLSGVITFLIQGVRPLSWWDAIRARRAARLALAIWIALLLALIVVILITEKRIGPFGL